MPGIFLKFEVGTRGKAGSHARYITRAPATKKSESALILHNYPEVISGYDYDDTRERIIAFNEGAESAELARKRRGCGQTRTFYKVIMSFEGTVDTDLAREMARGYLEGQFPFCIALAAVHQDTAHTHVHVNLLARQTNGKKIQLKNRDYKRLDERWAAAYGERFGLEKAIEHYRKKEEMREWKRNLARGQRGTPYPQRAPRERLGKDYRREELRGYDKAGIRGSERSIAGGERAAQASVGEREYSFALRDEPEQRLDRAGEEARRAGLGVRETVEIFKRLGAEIERQSREGRGVERGR